MRLNLALKVISQLNIKASINSMTHNSPQLGHPVYLWNLRLNGRLSRHDTLNFPQSNFPRSLWDGSSIVSGGSVR